VLGALPVPLTGICREPVFRWFDVRMRAARYALEITLEG
jgi:hypothetical protein